MALQKAEAFVLRAQNLGETSKILTLYTRQFGKIKVVAKGARSTKSRFGGTLEPLNHIAIVFYRKENRDLQLLSQADLLEYFPGIRQSLEKTALALGAAEVIHKTEIGEHPSYFLFKLLGETLHGIDRAHARVRNFLWAFYLKFFEAAGFKPHFENCLECRRAEKTNLVTFNLAKGGYLCSRCASPDPFGVTLSPESLEALRSLQPLAPHMADRLAISAQTHAEIQAWANAYLKFHFEGLDDLATMKVLEQMKRGLVIDK